jgi:DNA-binding MarR family transcriptional regulator
VTERAPVPLDAETVVHEAPAAHKDELRLWLRLLTCANLIETEIRRKLREQFHVTLPRFDLLAQLDKVPNGLTLSDLSRRMMVSNGNLTALVERLTADGLIERRINPADRRIQIVSLTASGRRDFRRIAERHADWIADLMAELGEADIAGLMAGLARLKASARKVADRRGAPSALGAVSRRRT